MLEGEEVALWRLTLISRWSKAKFKKPCNFEESPYVAHIFLPRAIYENVYIVFIEILCYSLSILKVTFLKSNPFRLKETLISFNIKLKWHHEKSGTVLR